MLRSIFLLVRSHYTTKNRVQPKHVTSSRFLDEVGNSVDSMKNSKQELKFYGNTDLATVKEPIRIGDGSYKSSNLKRG